MRKLLGGILLLSVIILVSSSVQAQTGNGGNITAPSNAPAVQTVAPSNARLDSVAPSNMQASAPATTKDLQGIYEDCGIGGLLFPRWPIGASVSNFTWDFGTTATTSGLTTPNACAGGKASWRPIFISLTIPLKKTLPRAMVSILICWPYFQRNHRNKKMPLFWQSELSSVKRYPRIVIRLLPALRRLSWFTLLLRNRLELDSEWYL